MGRFIQSLCFPIHIMAARWRFRALTPDRIQRYQRRRAGRIVRYAVRHSPFFQNHYAGHDLHDVWSLPVTNKAMMMANLSEYNTLGFSKNEMSAFCLEAERSRDFSRRFHGVNVGMSSGTSGSRGIEIVTPREEDFLRALFYARFSFPRGEKLNLAFMLRVSSPAFALGPFGHRLTYISQLNPIEKIAAELEQLQPNVLSAPASMLHLLAREARAGRLHIGPKRLISYAEVLYPDVESFLRDIFQCEVHQIYKCTEGAIAISCRHGRLHINEDLVAVQLLDANGLPTPAGQPCHRMIITDLCKRAQPIIRYELNDIITISDQPCPCGSSFRVISQIHGRSDDLFVARRIDGSGIEYIFPDFIGRSIISASDEIEEYQAIQESMSKVIIRIRPGAKADHERLAAAVKERLAEVFMAYRCLAPDLEVVFGPPQPNPRSLKLSRVIRTFTIDDDLQGH